MRGVKFADPSTIFRILLLILIVLFLITCLYLFSLFFILLMSTILSLLCLLLVIVRWPLLDYSMTLFEVAYLREMRQEVCPHHMVLIDVSTLYLTHRNEMICKKRPVIVSNPSNFT